MPTTDQSKRSRKSGGRIDLAALNPDVDKDGKLSQFEQEAWDLVQASDTDKNGYIDTADFWQLLTKVTEQAKAKHNLKRYLKLAVVFIFIQLLTLFADCLRCGH